MKKWKCWARYLTSHRINTLTNKFSQVPTTNHKNPFLLSLWLNNNFLLRLSLQVHRKRKKRIKFYWIIEAQLQSVASASTHQSDCCLFYLFCWIIHSASSNKATWMIRKVHKALSATFSSLSLISSFGCTQFRSQFDLQSSDTHHKILT